MSFEAELLNDQFLSNVVIRINDGIVFAKRQPDSGLTVPISQCILKDVGGLTLNPEVLDIQAGKTSFASNTIVLTDLGHIITGLFEDNAATFLNQKVEIWLGRSGVGMDFTDYYKMADTLVASWSFQNEDFTFVTNGITSRFNKALFNTQELLDANTAAGSATLVATGDISTFPASGTVFLEDEFLAYTSKNNGTKTFTLTGTTANDHKAAAVIFNVYTITNQNPIEILLKILQSSGGGTWDLYPEGLGLTDAQVDLTAITTLRDAVFASQLFSFKLFGIINILTWLETELLLVNSLRFIASDTSKLSVTILDASIFGASTRTINKTMVDPDSVAMQADMTLLQNVVTFNYGYDPAADKYLKSYTAKDAISIAAFGEKAPYVVNSKGVPATAGGDAIVLDRVTRWLARYSTATPTITMDVFMRQATILIGERVLISYDLPTAIGGRVFNKELEVLSKGLDEDRGIVSLVLGFTNYTGVREGYISPSDLALGYDGGAEIPYIEIPNGRGKLYQIGWIVDIISREVTSTFLTDYWPNLQIDTPAGTTLQSGLTITNIIPGLAGAPDILHFNGQSLDFTDAAIRLQFTDYNGVTADEQRYGFLSPGSGNFDDATPPYQITF